MLDLNRTYCMDCGAGMALLDPGCVDVIVTSPPYNLGKKYTVYNDKKELDEYLTWLEAIAFRSKRVLSDKGSFFLNVGGSLTQPWIPFDVARRFKQHYVLQNVIHWIKSVVYPDGTCSGHYQPITSPHYHHNDHEFIFHFTKNGDVELDKNAIGIPYQDKNNVSRWKSSGADLHDRGNVWFIPYATIKSARSHPSPFPPLLPEMCIRDHGVQRTGVVLDPFMGIGSTAQACRKLNVQYIGFDIDPAYVAAANEVVQ